MILDVWDIQPASYTAASTLAGMFSGGTIGALTRGRRNAIPGAIMFGLFGFTGQQTYNIIGVSRSLTVGRDDTKDLRTSQSLWHRMSSSKWSPLKVLSDEEHEAILKEKMLAIDAELAMLDEDIQQLKIK